MATEQVISGALLSANSNLKPSTISSGSRRKSVTIQALISPNLLVSENDSGAEELHDSKLSKFPDSLNVTRRQTLVSESTGQGALVSKHRKTNGRHQNGDTSPRRKSCASPNLMLSKNSQSYQRLPENLLKPANKNCVWMMNNPSLKLAMLNVLKRNQFVDDVISPDDTSYIEFKAASLNKKELFTRGKLNLHRLLNQGIFSSEFSRTLSQMNNLSVPTSSVRMQAAG